MPQFLLGLRPWWFLALALLLNSAIGLQKSLAQASPLAAVAFSIDHGLFQNPHKTGVALGRLRLAEAEVDFQNPTTADIWVLRFVPTGPLPAASGFVFDMPRLQFYKIPKTPDSVYVQVEDLGLQQKFPSLLKSSQPVALLVEKGLAVLGQVTADEAQALVSEADPGPILTQYQLPASLGPLGIREVSTQNCLSAPLSVKVLEVFTREGEFQAEPYVRRVELEFQQAQPTLGVGKGQKIKWNPEDFQMVGHPFMHHGPWDLSVTLTPAATKIYGLSDFSIYVWNSWTLTSSAGVYLGWPESGEKGPPCERDMNYLDPYSKARNTLIERAFEEVP